MDGFSLAAMLGVAVVMFAGGAATGYFLTVAAQQRATGGKTPAELRQELDDYRAKVNQHFEKSAELFHGLSVQYRDLYQHMAETANELVDKEHQSAALGFSGAAALIADSALEHEQSGVASPAPAGGSERAGSHVAPEPEPESERLADPWPEPEPGVGGAAAPGAGPQRPAAAEDIEEATFTLEPEEKRAAEEGAGGGEEQDDATVPAWAAAGEGQARGAGAGAGEGKGRG